MWNGIGWYGFIGLTTSTTDISLVENISGAFFFLESRPFVWNRLNKTCFNTKRFNGI